MPRRPRKAGYPAARLQRDGILRVRDALLEGRPPAPLRPVSRAVCRSRRRESRERGQHEHDCSKIRSLAPSLHDYLSTKQTLPGISDGPASSHPRPKRSLIAWIVGLFRSAFNPS